MAIISDIVYITVKSVFISERYKRAVQDGKAIATCTAPEP